MLDFVGQGLTSLKSLSTSVPSPTTILHLDLTFNKLQQLPQLSLFPNLRTIILDDNRVQSLQTIPKLSKLETLSINKNDLCDLTQLLQICTSRFPSLKNISLLKNPLNPFFEGEEQYKLYQDKILEAFPNIKTVDGVAVHIVRKDIEKKDREEEGKFEKMDVQTGIDERYKTEKVDTVKKKSEGNRFITKNQL